MDWGKAEILHVVGATVFVEQDVPIGPAHRALIEIMDHAVSVAFSIGPALVMCTVKAFLAPLSEQQFFVGERLLDQLEVFIFGCPSCPGFVLMEPCSPSIRCGDRVLKNGVGSVRDEVAVVVPNHDFFVPKTCLRHGWPQMKLQKIALFFCLSLIHI